MTVSGALFRALLALLALAPLPFGSHRPWAWSAAAVWIGVLTLIWCVAVATGRARLRVSPGRIWFIIAPFAVVLAWAAIQLTDLAPAEWRHPIWAEAAAALGAPLGGAISLDPAMTRTAILRFALFGGVFWLSLQLGRDAARAQLGLIVLARAGVLYAAYGLILHFLGSETILWYRKWAYLGDVTSSFINRNAFGAFAGIGVVLTIGLAAQHLSRIGPRDSAQRRTEAILLGAGPWLVGAGLQWAALMLSHSRGAFLATLLAVFTLILALAAVRMLSRRLAIIFCAVAAVILGGVLAVSGGVTLERLIETTDVEGDRGQLYRLTWSAIGDAPFLGHGFGAFFAAFRIYRDVSLPRPVIYDFAHNIHLELLMDLGVPATAAFYLMLLGAVGLCLRGLVKRRRSRLPPAAALSATVLLLFHGIVDFSAQMPAIAMIYAALLGFGCAQAWNSGELSGAAEPVSDDSDE